jgi:hypothetical protein
VGHERCFRGVRDVSAYPLKLTVGPGRAITLGDVSAHQAAVLNSRLKDQLRSPPPRRPRRPRVAGKHRTGAEAHGSSGGITPRQERKKMTPLCGQALPCPVSAASDRFCGLFLGVRGGIRDPAIDCRLAPTAAMLADPNLLWKRAVAHLTVKRGPAEAGSLEDGPHP